MSDAVQLRRQWVSIPHGSCDARIGEGAVEVISSTLRVTTSERPRCAFLVEEGAGPELTEAVRRELVDAGYDVVRHDIRRDVATLEDAAQILGTLSADHITADDLVFAVGGTAVLSLASQAAGCWVGGVRLALMPTDEQALLEVPVTPRWLSCAGKAGMVAVEPCAKHVFFDPAAADVSSGSETSRMARVLMVSTAVAESERSFSKLWDGAAALMGGDLTTLVTLLGDTLKSRGHLVSSTALAVRQSVTYGLDVMRALGACVPGVPASTLLAEALRFSARISAGLGKLPVDDVFAQDDLLQTLGLPDLECDVQPQQLIEALRGIRFERTRRFLVSVPQQLGRVRYMAVDDDLLLEHVTAWCDSHRAQHG